MAEAAPVTLPAWLQEPVVPLAWLWRIARSDGLTLGFTSHDRDLVRDGTRYVATPGIRPSAVSLSAALETDTMDIAGALTADAITAADLEAGRWDGAAVSLAVCPWDDESIAPIPVAAGTLGTVERTRGAFSAELQSCGGRDAALMLARPVAPETAPTCRARLGDAACRVNLAPRTHCVRIASIDDVRVTISDTIVADDYAYGRLRFLDGPNAGLTRLIVSGEGQALILSEAPAFALASGARVEIIEGCDRTIATCSARFANAVNFRGEPYLPGMDYITRYPGAG